MADFASGISNGLSIGARMMGGFDAGFKRGRSEIEHDFERLEQQRSLMNQFVGDDGKLDAARIDANPELFRATLGELTNNRYVRSHLLPKDYVIDGLTPLDERRGTINLRNIVTGAIAPFTTKGAKDGDDVVVHDMDSLRGAGDKLLDVLRAKKTAFSRVMDETYGASEAPETPDAEVPPHMDFGDAVWGDVRKAFRAPSTAQQPAPTVDIPRRADGVAGPEDSGFVIPGLDAGRTSAFMEKMVGAESSGDPNAEFVDNRGRKFAGLYQIGQQRLTDGIRAGVVPAGTTLEDLQADPKMQKRFGQWHFSQHAANLEKDGLIGTAVHPETGEPLSVEALLAAAQLGGYSGMKQWLAGGYNPGDQLDTKIGDYARRFNVRSAAGGAGGAGEGTAWKSGSAKVDHGRAETGAPAANATDGFANEALGGGSPSLDNGQPFFTTLGEISTIPGKIARGFAEIGTSAAKAVDKFAGEKKEEFMAGRGGKQPKPPEQSKWGDLSIPAADVAKATPEQREQINQQVAAEIPEYLKRPPKLSEGSVNAANRPNPSVKALTRMAATFVDFGWATPLQAQQMVQGAINASAETEAKIRAHDAAAKKAGLETFEKGQELVDKNNERLRGWIEEAMPLFAQFDKEAGQYRSLVSGKALGKEPKVVAGAALSLLRANLSNPSGFGIQEVEARRLLRLMTDPAAVIAPRDQILLTQVLERAVKHMDEYNTMSDGEGKGSRAGGKALHGESLKLGDKDGNVIGTVDELQIAFEEKHGQSATPEELKALIQANGWVPIR